SIGSAAVVEGSGKPLTFTLSLSQPSASTTFADLATADGTAVAGTNYTAAAGHLVLAPQQTSLPFTIATFSDHAALGDKQFYVDLTGGGTTIATSRGTGTIRDADGPQSRLLFDSEAGDYIGLGLKQDLDVVDGEFISNDGYGNAAAVHFEGDTWWDTMFQ